MTPERERPEPDHISFEEVVSNAKEVMLREGQHLPLVVLETNSKVLVSHIPDMPLTYGERVELMQFLGQFVAKSGSVGRLEQVFMVSEGWLRETKDDQSELSPSQDPNRREVLIISGIQMKERKKRLELLQIIRDADERVTRLEEFLPEGQKREEIVEIPLLEAFVQGFQTAFRTKYN